MKTSFASSGSYNKPISQYSSNKTKENIEILFVFIIMCIVLFVWIVPSNKKNSKFNFGKSGNKVSNKIPLYRDIPFNGNIYMAFFIAYNYNIIKKKSNILGAILLKWLNERKIIINKSENGYNIAFYQNITCKNYYESTLYKMFYEASKDGSITV